MLTCYSDQVRLPQNDAAYVGFRLAVLDTLCQMEMCQEFNVVQNRVQKPWQTVRNPVTW